MFWVIGKTLIEKQKAMNKKEEKMTQHVTIEESLLLRGTSWGIENWEPEAFQKCCTALLLVESNCRGGNRASQMLDNDSISAEERMWGVYLLHLLPPLSKGWQSLFISLSIAFSPSAVTYKTLKELYLFYYIYN